MSGIWFVTPAYQRYALSEVCFEQRARVIATLKEQGIEAHCVVVADDENVDIARSFGFSVVEQNNEWLGRKFNDGMQFAGRRGAEWVVPIGSDSWIDPAYFLPLPHKWRTRSSRLYCVVTADRLGELSVADVKGAGPYVFQRFQLQRTRFRPAKDELARGVDRSTVESIRSINWEQQDVHPFQYVGFRGEPHLTPYEGLVKRWGVREHTDPWAILARHYPQDLVDRARGVLTMQKIAA